MKNLSTDFVPDSTHKSGLMTAAHKYMLEKEDFYSEFSIAPNVDRRTKAGKEQWQQFLESSN